MKPSNCEMNSHNFPPNRPPDTTLRFSPTDFPSLGPKNPNSGPSISCRVSPILCNPDIGIPVHNSTPPKDVMTHLEPQIASAGGNKLVVNLNLKDFVQESNNDTRNHLSAHEIASSNFVAALGSWCQRVSGMQSVSKSQPARGSSLLNSPATQGSIDVTESQKINEINLDGTEVPLATKPVNPIGSPPPVIA
ncbi:hypothetical protein HanOQP8_Chr06g0207621 [Helianthus annuus]|nr:hypothetical protein HanHA89_Chr06g0213391 [Helianthus annuus]KAJ0736674.1 hypothetical protein HanLR1_Chr06g0198561 [Helianthus annuus]KAJ0739607.1 hypothetical protein HanOQP8_Chr06g0207621 [Helianthus annuus]